MKIRFHENTQMDLKDKRSVTLWDGLEHGLNLLSFKIPNLIQVKMNHLLKYPLCSFNSSTHRSTVFSVFYLLYIFVEFVLFFSPRMGGHWQ